MGPSETTSKHLLLLLNFVFAVLGLLLIGCGIYFLAYMTDVSIGEDLAGWLIICLGIVIVIIAAFGCVAATQKSPKRLLAYVIAMGVLILTQLLLLSMVSHGTKDGISGSVNEGFEKLWDEERNVTGALAYYESWLHCCGVNGPDDYAVLNHDIPKTCCPNLKCVDRSSIYKPGCKSKCMEYLDDRLLVFKIVCWLLIVGEAAGIFYAWMLMTGLKNNGRRQNAVWM